MFSKFGWCKESWTIKFNSVVLALLPFFDYAQVSFPQLQPYVGADVYKVGMLVILVGNIILRFKTNRKVSQ